MIFFFALHLILSSYFDVVDTRPSNDVNTRYLASPSKFPWGTSLVLLFLSRFLTSLVVFSYFVDVSLTHDKRNKRLQKFNGSYQALTEVNLIR